MYPCFLCFRLLTRVHEVLKQCRDLKTDNGQKERRIDELMEENGALAAQVRSAFAQLGRAEEEVAKLTEAHDSSQTEWGNRRDLLQRELSQALLDRVITHFYFEYFFHKLLCF